VSQTQQKLKNFLQTFESDCVYFTIPKRHQHLAVFA